jgi:hypothetical protein
VQLQVALFTTAAVPSQLNQLYLVCYILEVLPHAAQQEHCHPWALHGSSDFHAFLHTNAIAHAAAFCSCSSRYSSWQLWDISSRKQTESIMPWFSFCCTDRAECKLSMPQGTQSSNHA